MNNLLTNTATMSSREIAELTGKQLSHIHRDFKKMMVDLGVDNGGLMPNPFMDQGFTYDMDGQNRISAINLNQELTLTLVSGYSAKLRNSIINRWQELESQQAPAIPQTYAAALIEAGRLAQVAEEQAEQLAIAAPKVEFHDTVVNSTHTFSTRDAAKKINQRPIKFGEWLKGNGYLCLNGRAAQKYIDMGLFVTHTGISESDHAYTQTRMTIKGCAYFANKLFEIKL